MNKVKIGEYVFVKFPWATYTAYWGDADSVVLVWFFTTIRLKQEEFDGSIMLGVIERVSY